MPPTTNLGLIMESCKERAGKDVLGVDVGVDFEFFYRCVREDTQAVKDYYRDSNSDLRGDLRNIENLYNDLKSRSTTSEADLRRRRAALENVAALWSESVRDARPNYSVKAFPEVDILLADFGPNYVMRISCDNLRGSRIRVQQAQEDDSFNYLVLVNYTINLKTSGFELIEKRALALGEPGAVGVDQQKVVDAAKEMAEAYCN